MLKRILSFALCVILSLAIGMNAFASEDNSSNYLIYDIETGEITKHSFNDLSTDKSLSSPAYFPEDEEEHDLPSESGRALIGGEDSLTKITRTARNPYRSTVYIEIVYNNGSISTFTGFVIGPSAVVTAGHCVINAFNNNNYRTINVIPAKNGATEPFGSTTVNRIVVPEYVQNGPAADDWAILELNDPIGEETGWLGLTSSSSSLVGTSVISTGYADYGTISGQTSDDSYMYEGTGTIRESTATMLKGDWSAVSGFSGGPVFTSGYVALGILTGGSPIDGPLYAPNTYYTTATRITPDMYSLFMEYR